VIQGAVDLPDRPHRPNLTIIPEGSFPFLTESFNELSVVSAEIDSQPECVSPRSSDGDTRELQSKSATPVALVRSPLGRVEV
jgi:hypothetical protein